MLKKTGLIMFVSLFLLGVTISAFAGAPALPDKKKTSLELYVSAQDAYNMWKKNPAKVVIIDCRTPHEYSYIGHAPMAHNIPTKFTTTELDVKKKKYKSEKNAAFVAEIKKNYKKDQTILMMCRSGNRSAKATNALAKEGFTKVYNIYDGFEGDKNKQGKRAVNGWRLAGNPWTYKIDPSLAYSSK